MDLEIKKDITSNWFKMLQEAIWHTITNLERKDADIKTTVWNKSKKRDEGGGEFRILENRRCRTQFANRESMRSNLASSEIRSSLTFDRDALSKFRSTESFIRFISLMRCVRSLGRFTALRMLINHSSRSAAPHSGTRNSLDR